MGKSVNCAPRWFRTVLPAALRVTCWFALMWLVDGNLIGAADLLRRQTFIDQHCSSCHNDVDREAHLDLTSLEWKPSDPANFATWVKVHDRVKAGEMPPKKKPRPDPQEVEGVVGEVATDLINDELARVAQEGRSTQRRLNGYEYENALRDLLRAPWLQIRGQFPEDGESHRFNKVGDALDVSHVHLARYLGAADYAIREALGVQFERPPTMVRRYYARDQRTLTSKFTPNIFNTSPDRLTYPVQGWTAQPDVRARKVPLSVGENDPAGRELEAVGWVSSNYVTGFTYRWDGFRAPVAGRYRVRFSGYTLWVRPGGVAMRFKDEKDVTGTPRPPNPWVPDYNEIERGRRPEPITVYTRNGVMNRRVAEFDLTPEPAVHDLGEIWLLANETLVPDASRFYRSRPNNFRNPLMEADGAPSVAFRWMEVEGPLDDENTTAGYQLLFGDLPLRRVPEGGRGGVILPRVNTADRRATSGRNAGQRLEPMEDVAVEVVSQRPKEDAERLLRTFVARAYRRLAEETEISQFLALVVGRMDVGLSFTEAMVAGYTAVLASPSFVFLDEQPGPLDGDALALRLSLFLWNSIPDGPMLALARNGELLRPKIVQRETERLLRDPRSERFFEAFLDYWLDLRKIEDSTPSTTLYNDYYLDDALTEASVAETRRFFRELLERDLPARNLVNSDFTFLNERLARHYGIDGVEGIAMRRVSLPGDSPRGGLMTQASVLKVTANGTTTSPVLRGLWITERILGRRIPPPPPVAAVEPDIRGAVTIREQLAKHRSDPSCASCHNTMDPPGFALESFDVMGGWRDRYRAADEKRTPEKGLGKNGHAFAFHYALPVDASGTLPDGRDFSDIRDFKRLLLQDESHLARNLVQQWVVYATGSPVRFSDRLEVDRIVAQARLSGYGVRSLLHALVQSPLFLNK